MIDWVGRWTLDSKLETCEIQLLAILKYIIERGKIRYKTILEFKGDIRKPTPGYFKVHYRVWEYK